MTNCVDCPSPENYAAIALQLQETALQAEQCLYDIQTQMRAASNPPTLVLTSTATEGGIQDTMLLLGFGAPVVTFSNMEQDSFLGLWPEGVWQVGVTVNAIATGAVNAQTQRELFITVRGADDPPSVANRYQAMVSVYEPNNGLGQDMALCTTVVVGARERISFFFRHDNSSSSMNISVGARYWATRISDTTALRVV